MRSGSGAQLAMREKGGMVGTSDGSVGRFYYLTCTLKRKTFEFWFAEPEGGLYLLYFIF